MTADRGDGKPAAAGPAGRPGVVPSQGLRALIDTGALAADTPIEERQIQPASLDLRLGATAWRVRASFLPGPGATVRAKLDGFAMHAIDLRRGAVLEKGCVYIAQLQERLALPGGTSGVANPRSSTGRLDVFTRLIADHGGEFDRVPPGYAGPLYAEISPRTFSILVREGSQLNQLRLRRGDPMVSDAALRRLQAATPLAHGAIDPANISQGLAFSAHLHGQGESGLIGWRARRHTGLIDLDAPGACAIHDFWEPVLRRPGERAELILDPGEFYILASREFVTVPPDHAAEMRAYDARIGEFRAHYAGFFDPGFGHGATGASRTRAVLEVRSHEVPFVLTDGQVVCRLVYESMVEPPDKLYGDGRLASAYQGQGLKLSRHFRPDG